MFHHHHHHHHISVMQSGHLLTRSGLTYPEVSTKFYHDSFCLLGNSVSLPWVIYFETFCLHVVSSFPCTNISFDLKQRIHINKFTAIHLSTTRMFHYNHHHHHHHISVMQLGHLLTRSGLMYPDISS